MINGPTGNQPIPPVPGAGPIISGGTTSTGSTSAGLASSGTGSRKGSGSPIRASAVTGCFGIWGVFSSSSGGSRRLVSACGASETRFPQRVRTTLTPSVNRRSPLNKRIFFRVQKMPFFRR
jgi:hypothetical protein